MRPKPPPSGGRAQHHGNAGGCAKRPSKACTEGSEGVKMPTTAELLEAKAAEAALLRVLVLAKDCKDLDELTEKVKAMLSM